MSQNEVIQKLRSFIDEDRSYGYTDHKLAQGNALFLDRTLKRCQHGDKTALIRAKEILCQKSFRDKLQKEGLGFIDDGIVNEEDFEKCDVKLVFVMREANCDGDGNAAWPLVQKVREGNSGARTWDRIAWWLDALYKTQYETLDVECRKKLFSTISVINLKKTAGGSSVNPKIFNGFVNKYSKELKEQFVLYKFEQPTIFLCCGKSKGANVFDTLKRIMSVNDEGKCEGFRYAHIGGSVAVEYYHPSCRRSRAKYCAEFPKLIQKLVELRKK